MAITMTEGLKAYKISERIFSICRSNTGNGVRQI